MALVQPRPRAHLDCRIVSRRAAPSRTQSSLVERNSRPSKLKTVRRAFMVTRGETTSSIRGRYTASFVPMLEKLRRGVHLSSIHIRSTDDEPEDASKHCIAMAVAPHPEKKFI